MFSEQQIQSFRVIWKQNFGEEISKEQALKEGLRMVRLVEVICKPANEVEYQRLHQICDEIGPCQNQQEA